jgi:hypothetical protein
VQLQFHEDKEIIVLARSPQHLLEIVDVVLRLLAVSVVHSVWINNWSSVDGTLVNAATLANFIEQCQSLKVLTLKIEMDEDHCRVLDAFSRPDLEIVLARAKLRVPEQALWQRSLDAIRDRPNYILVKLTMLFSRMACAETVV